MGDMNYEVDVNEQMCFVRNSEFLDEINEVAASPRDDVQYEPLPDDMETNLASQELWDITDEVLLDSPKSDLAPDTSDATAGPSRIYDADVLVKEGSPFFLAFDPPYSVDANAVPVHSHGIRGSGLLGESSDAAIEISDSESDAGSIMNVDGKRSLTPALLKDALEISEEYSSVVSSGPCPCSPCRLIDEIVENLKKMDNTVKPSEVSVAKRQRSTTKSTQLKTKRRQNTWRRQRNTIINGIKKEVNSTLDIAPDNMLHAIMSLPEGTFPAAQSAYT